MTAQRAQRATQAAGAATKRGVAPMATPAAVPGATGLRPGVGPSARPVPVSRLARVLAEGLVHIAERRAAEEAEHST